MNIMYKLLLILCSSLLFPFFGQAQTAAAPPGAHQQHVPMIQKGQKITYKTIQAEDQTWGYEIAIDKTPFIRQTSIPGQSGNKGFLKMKQAETAAKLVVEKLERNEAPAISEEELLQIMKAAQ